MKLNLYYGINYSISYHFCSVESPHEPEAHGFWLGWLAANNDPSVSASHSATVIGTFGCWVLN